MRVHDQEEYLYREAMMTQYANLALVLLKYGGDHVEVYKAMEQVLTKTRGHFDLAESFTTMEGVQALLKE